MTLARIRDLLAVLGGSQALPERLESQVLVAFARGAWWIVLLLLAWAFAGRATKFVYVDF